MKQMQEEHAEVNKRWASLDFSAQRCVEIKNCDTKDFAKTDGLQLKKRGRLLHRNQHCRYSGKDMQEKHPKITVIIDRNI